MWNYASIHQNFGSQSDAKRFAQMSVVSKEISLSIKHVLDKDFAASKQIHISSDVYNLENAVSVEALFSSFNLTADQPIIFVLDDILQTLEDPRILLRALRKALYINSANCFVLSVTLRDDKNNKKPEQNHYIRHWTKNEFLAFLEFGLFDVQDVVIKNNTLVAVVVASQGFSDKKRQVMGLPATSNQLLVFSEHSDYCITGGIGTYVKEYMNTVDEKPLFLITNVWHDGGEAICKKMGWFHLNQLVAPENYWDTCASMAYHGQILEAVLQILYLYDDIISIEYQEYLGIGSRIAQAKCAGLIPSSVCVVVSCHGGHPYLEAANRQWFGKSALPYFVAEKISIEYADKAVLPSQFLANLYKQQGMILPNEQILRLPFPFIELDHLPNGSCDIERVVFFGKKCAMKGYQDFLNACILLLETQKTIKTILVVGPEIDIDADTRDLETKLKTLTTINYITLKRAEVHNYLKALRSDSLVVLPYLGDNHPMAFMEVLDAAVPFVAYQAGGMPEMVPQSYHDLCMCLPNAHSLSDKISQNITNSAQRFTNFWPLFKQVREDYVAINSQYQVRHNADVGAKNIVTHKDSNLISVIVPVYNTELSQIGDLITGLRAQRLQPAETIFIDDCSKSDYSGKLKIYLQKNMVGLNYRLVHHDVNKGLSAARNTAISLVNTRYVAVHDSDNVMCQNFLYDGVQALDNNKDLTCVTFFLQHFKDGTDFNDFSQKSYRYHPLGHSVLLNLMINELGDAMGVYRVSKIKELGGWDDVDKSAFEDWAFYLKVVSQGEKMLVIPKEEGLYRVRDTSMFRTYNHYDAWRRLPRSIKNIPVFDSYRLLGIFKNSETYTTAPGEIQQVLEIIKARLRPYPRLKCLMVWSLRKSLAVYRRIFK